MVIQNQEEVTRLRLKCFTKHGCLGWWQDEYATLQLAVLIALLEAKQMPELAFVIRALKKLY